ncbi:MAG: TlpA family protein disulfide reductase [Acidobacteria bacterium]|nr:MAG: TlpA family protein disulfide reductase [Acidobacteriota bacterium]
MKARCRLPAVAALGLALLACGAAERGRLHPGAPSPPFTLAALDGASFDSRSLAGRPAVLNFWATWCQPCWREIPELQALAREGRVAVVSIALDEEGARTVAPFVARRGIDYPVLLGDQELFRRFDGLTIPYTLLLDPAQRVARIYRGPTSRAAIEADLVEIERAL